MLYTISFKIYVSLTFNYPYAIIWQRKNNNISVIKEDFSESNPPKRNKKISFKNKE